MPLLTKDMELSFYSLSVYTFLFPTLKLSGHLAVCFLLDSPPALARCSLFRIKSEKIHLAKGKKRLYQLGQNVAITEHIKLSVIFMFRNSQSVVRDRRVSKNTKAFVSAEAAQHKARLMIKRNSSFPQLGNMNEKMNDK